MNAELETEAKSHPTSTCTNTCNYGDVSTYMCTRATNIESLEEQAHASMFDKPDYISKKMQTVGNCEVPLELPRNFTCKERASFCSKRFERRHAVQVGDGKRLTELLEDYIVGKHLRDIVIF